MRMPVLCGFALPKQNTEAISLQRGEVSLLVVAEEAVHGRLAHCPGPVTSVQQGRNVRQRKLSADGSCAGKDTLAGPNFPP